MKVLIAGCGYVGTALGSELVKAGHEVWGLRRDAGSARALEQAGIKPILANLLRADELKDLPDVDTLVLCQAPSRKHDQYQDVYFEATKNLLGCFPAKQPLRKVLLISSTSVYATADGSWVDEHTDPMTNTHSDAEARENAKIMLAQELLVLNSGHPAIVFRLAGIYGPGRNRVLSILEGRVQPVLSDIYMNRIHQHDLVRAMRLLLDRGQAGETYIGADDSPCTQREFYSWVFEKLARPFPSSGNPQDRPHGSNKRCSNKKLKTLGFQFRYPSYREGYMPLIEQAMKDLRQETKPRSGWFS